MSEAAIIVGEPTSQVVGASVGRQVIEFTEFPDRMAMSRRTRTSTWPDFVQMLATPPSVAAKDKQPLLKLATFGERRTEGGCYRTDKNVLQISGIEGDYDAEKVSPEEAVAALERHGIRAVVYTSWSHKDDAPRWRVVCPTSRQLPPGERQALTSRLNGALGGVLAGESFTLSQSYYFGRSRDGVYRCLTTFNDPEEGECIDELSSLDAIAIRKSGPSVREAVWGSQFPPQTAQIGAAAPNDDWIGALLDGDDVHGNALRVVGRMVAKGYDDSTIKDLFRALEPQVAHARGRDRARELLGSELDRMIVGARAKGFAPRTDAEISGEIQKLIFDATLSSTVEDVPKFITRLVQLNPPKASQVDAVLRAIKRKHGTTIGALRSDLRAAHAERARELRGGGPLPKEPDQSSHALSVIERIGNDNIIFTLDAFWMWGAGVWRRADDREVKQIAQVVLDEDEDVFVTKSMVDGVVDNIKNRCHTKERLFDPDYARGVVQVNVLNGTLDWNDCARAWGLREHRREDYLTAQLPIPYDPTAKAPRFEQFLGEVFAGDADAHEKIECVLEMIGYSLLRTCRYEQFAILIGSGANGKSVLLSVLEYLIGPRDVAGVQPSQFDNKFQRAHLHGKLVNIVTEIAEGAEIPDAELKGIVSGELTTAEHKNRDPFEFHPFATCWFGTNHMPHTRDFTEATFRRAIVLKFNNRFEGARRDSQLKGKLITEAPGILALALDRIGKAIVRGSITIPPSSAEAAREWRRDVDQVRQFVEECCIADSTAVVPSADLYQAYRRWADAAGIARKLGRNAFTRRAVDLGGLARKGGRDGTRMICGWALRPRIA